jgi:hypothetical protein
VLIIWSWLVVVEVLLVLAPVAEQAGLELALDYQLRRELPTQ